MGGPVADIHLAARLALCLLLVHAFATSPALAGLFCLNSYHGIAHLNGCQQTIDNTVKFTTTSSAFCSRRKNTRPKGWTGCSVRCVARGRRACRAPLVGQWGVRQDGLSPPLAQAPSVIRVVLTGHDARE